MSDRGCATCCRSCRKRAAAERIMAANQAARAAGSLAADKRLGCPPRNTPCAEEPGGRRCWGEQCSPCKGWKPEPKTLEDDA